MEGISEPLLPISAAISEIWAQGAAPRERAVREDMMERGFVWAASATLRLLL